MVNRIELLQKLKRYPIFNIKIVNDIINKEKKYCALVVHRLKKTGLIKELEKDKFTLCNDPLVVASHMVWPCYLSSWTAIRFYNLTEQLPNYVYVVTTRPRKRRKIQFGNTTIGFSRVKTENFFGFGKIRQGEFEVFMAEKEKALADALYLKQISFETIVEIIKEHKKEIRMQKLRRYLICMKMERFVTKINEALKI